MSVELKIALASVVAGIIRARASYSKATFLTVLFSFIVAVISGVLFTSPIIALLNLNASHAILVAVVTALSAENIMLAITKLSSNQEVVKNIFSAIFGKTGT